jgi:phosphoserine phosphatase RsbU/P
MNSAIAFPATKLLVNIPLSLQIAGYMEVADKPGGDFYDFHQHDNGNISLIIGDVSGKGQLAAQYMQATKNIFHELVVKKMPAAELINRLNESVSVIYDRLHFITLTYVEIDVVNKLFTYIRAGHCPVLFYDYKKNLCRYMEDKGTGLGIVRDGAFSATIHNYKIPVNSNDIVVLFTDGFVEAVDEESGNLFEMSDLKTVVESNYKSNSDTICNSILQQFRSRIKTQKDPDDLALIVIKFA